MKQFINWYFLRQTSKPNPSFFERGPFWLRNILAAGIVGGCFYALVKTGPHPQRDIAFLKAAFSNPFVIVAFVLLVAFYINLDYMFFKISKYDSTLSEERVSDWQRIRALYLQHYGKDLVIWFHQQLGRLAFISLVMGVIWLTK